MWSERKFLDGRRKAMSTEVKSVSSGNRWKVSLDTWAVLAAFLAALLIRAGVFKHIPW
jgi:hypothetical protein